MADLSEVIGALIAGLADARRQADETTAQIAELYRDHALLTGMSVPRIRVPEMSIELPFVVDEMDDSSGPSLQSEDDLVSETSRALQKAVNSRVVDGTRTTLPRRLRQSFQEGVRERYRQLEQARFRTNSASREGVAAAVRAEATRVVRELERREQQRHSTGGEESGPAAAGPSAGWLSIVAQVEAVAWAGALQTGGRPARLQVNVLTREVREVPSEHVIRMKLVLREEGMEWTAGEDIDGATTRSLTPE